MFHKIVTKKLILGGGLLCLFISLLGVSCPGGRDPEAIFWNAYPYKVHAIITFDTGKVTNFYPYGEDSGIIYDSPDYRHGRLSALRIEQTTGELLADYPSDYVARIALNYANDEIPQQWVFSTKGLFKVDEQKWKSLGDEKKKAFAYYNSDAAVEELRARIGEVILP